MYEKLFEPGRIGSMTIKNRGIMMPMATDMADKDGLPTQRQIRYYQERAKGGIGMIINEYTGVDDVDSIPSIHNLRAARDYHISALEELTDAVHLYDCKIVAQIHHGGATSNPAFTGRDNLAPSPVPIADGRPVPKEMTQEDIRRVQGKFIDAAVRCCKAGYDGVELHGAHGYLIAQFFSKYYNRRNDEYGGSVENRCRFVREIIEGIRAKLGPDYPILLRMCGDEMTPVDGFLSLEEGLEIARYLETLGIDAINISNGSARNGDANCEPFSYQPGWKKHVARAYREALSIPVIATNTIKDPDFAEQLLEEGVCDFVGLGRSQLADPQFMNKAKAGRAAEIRRCIGCLYCRERVLGGGLPIRCSVNARTAREIEFPALHPSGKGETVAVIGGGPAGMEAARVLALRGFHPVLFEKEQKLGGTLNVADQPLLKDKITALTESLKAELAALGDRVEIRTGVEATPEIVGKLDPVGVIVAAGAEPVVPQVPGVRKESLGGSGAGEELTEGAQGGAHADDVICSEGGTPADDVICSEGGAPADDVICSEGGTPAGGGHICVITAEDFISGRAAANGNICIIGSGLTGLEAAEMLLAGNDAIEDNDASADPESTAIADNNISVVSGSAADSRRGSDTSAGNAVSSVSIVEMLPEIGPGIFPAIRNDELSRILPYEPAMYPGHQLVRVNDDSVTIRELATGDEKQIPADTVIMAVGIRPRSELLEEFRSAFANVMAAGDVRKGGRIATAIRQGFEAGYTFRALR